VIARRRVVGPESLWELLNLGSPAETAWMVEAVCAQTDPDAFFPERDRSDPRPAKAVCRVCPVRVECLEYAQQRRDRFGIWGGLSPEERAARRRAARLEGEAA
jgi:WhiB family redox-sensing transcriptional regulator